MRLNKLKNTSVLASKIASKIHDFYANIFIRFRFCNRVGGFTTFWCIRKLIFELSSSKKPTSVREKSSITRTECRKMNFFQKVQKSTYHAIFRICCLKHAALPSTSKSMKKNWKNWRKRWRIKNVRNDQQNEVRNHKLQSGIAYLFFKAHFQFSLRLNKLKNTSVFASKIAAKNTNILFNDSYTHSMLQQSWGVHDVLMRSKTHR